MRAMAGRTYSLLRRTAPTARRVVHVVRPRPVEKTATAGATAGALDGPGGAGPLAPGRTGPPAWGARPQLSSRCHRSHSRAHEAATDRARSCTVQRLQCADLGRPRS